MSKHYLFTPSREGSSTDTVVKLYWLKLDFTQDVQLANCQGFLNYNGLERIADIGDIRFVVELPLYRCD